MDFVVLPDCPLPAWPVAERGIDHPSGRPWVIGSWEDEDEVLVEAGPRKLLVLGRTSIDRGKAEKALASLQSLRDLDRVAYELPGAVHLIARTEEGVRAQGSLSTSRQIFWAIVEGAAVAAGSPGPLVERTAAGLDERVLAARLLAPSGAPWPLFQRLPWAGIESLLAGHWLHLDNVGRARQVRWWQAPEASLPLAEAAGELRTALSEALALRSHGTVSADLSGGLDSTCLCFLAAHAGASLVTFHMEPIDAGNEDTVWARRAAEYLPSARHYLLPADRPENLLDPGGHVGSPDPEGPGTWAGGLPHVHDLTRRVRAEGARLHLFGIGGDELFGLLPAFPWSYVRAAGLRGLAQVSRFRLGNRWGLAATARELLDRRGFAESLALAGDQITLPVSPDSTPEFGWVAAPRMPQWATSEAVREARALLCECAGTGPVPLDADRTRHQALTSLVFEGTTARQINTAIAGTGVRWEAPFLDDRVIDAALSVRMTDRMITGRFKPLLTTAVQGVVPPAVLARRTKGEFSAEVFMGLRRNRDRFLALTEDSRLGALGLIDPAVLRSAVLVPGARSQNLLPFASTLACETWLRAHQPTTVGGPL